MLFEISDSHLVGMDHVTDDRRSCVLEAVDKTTTFEHYLTVWTVFHAS